MLARGLDPSVARYFRDAPRFSEGARVVDLTVNGERIGLTDVRFDHEGKLCFTRGLLDRAGLHTPTAVINNQVGADQACHDFLAEFPSTILNLNPGSEAVSIVAPTQSIREPQRATGHFVRGGTAALLNYDVQGVNSHSRGDTGRFLSASTEVGFNVGDWIARSRQLYLSTEGRSSTEHLYAYAQRDIAPLASTFQVGQISSRSPVFGGVQMTGVQLSPDGVEGGGGGNGVVVEGQALSQSRVEVRQSGALIYTTVVPEGPFALSNLPLLNGTSDLEVRVIETRGGQRSFVVPAASFRGAVPMKSGYTAAVGRVRDVDRSGADEPLLGMASGTFALSPSTTLSSGVQATDDYNALGVALDSSFSERFSVGFRNNLSRDGEKNVRGMQNSISLGSALPRDVQMTLSATTQTRGYRDVLDAVRTDVGEATDSRFKNQYTAGLSWADPQLGAFSVGYTRAAHFNSRTSSQVHGFWSKDFKYANVGLSMDSQVGNTGNQKEDNEGVGVRLQISVPLGGDRALTSTARHQGGRSSIGTAYSERVDDTLNYELRADSDLAPDVQHALGGTLNTTSRYAQLGLGVNRDATSSSYSGQLQGAVVAHERGLTLSPYRVEDTFGVASVGDVSGARITTAQGPVWTDHWGMAVIPGLPAYQSSFVAVEGKSLPRLVDIKNGTKTLEVGRGSFSTVDFEVVKVRRLLLRATDASGQPLPKGASVFAADKTFLTTVVGDGLIFLNNIDSPQALTVSAPNATSCTLQIDLAEQSDGGQHYESSAAVCR
ncbi:outer membrane usher protein [Pseudomonas sp. S35]|nr:outer membrane usher protein [Pseudomonas sp. S35]